MGPKFCAKERKQLNLSRFYAISQIEYCRNLVFERNFPIHKLFERSRELGLWPHRAPFTLVSACFGQLIDERLMYEIVKE